MTGKYFFLYEYFKPNLKFLFLIYVIFKSVEFIFVIIFN